MCLIVKKGTKEKITENDIICYKKINLDSMQSESQGFQYESGKLYKTKFTIAPKDARLGYEIFTADRIALDKYRKYFNDDGEGGDNRFFGATVSDKLVVYQEGFHSYKAKERDICNVECIIPKGTKYVEDETGLICSEAIIINRILE